MLRCGTRGRPASQTLHTGTARCSAQRRLGRPPGARFRSFASRPLRGTPASAGPSASPWLSTISGERGWPARGAAALREACAAMLGLRPACAKYTGSRYRIVLCAGSLPSQRRLVLRVEGPGHGPRRHCARYPFSNPFLVCFFLDRLTHGTTRRVHLVASLLLCSRG